MRLDVVYPVTKRRSKSPRQFIRPLVVDTEVQVKKRGAKKDDPAHPKTVFQMPRNFEYEGSARAYVRLVEEAFVKMVARNRPEVIKTVAMREMGLGTAVEPQTGRVKTSSWVHIVWAGIAVLAVVVCMLVKGGPVG